MFSFRAAGATAGVVSAAISKKPVSQTELQESNGPSSSTIHSINNQEEDHLSRTRADKRVRSAFENSPPPSEGSISDLAVRMRHITQLQFKVVGTERTLHESINGLKAHCKSPSHLTQLIAIATVFSEILGNIVDLNTKIDKLQIPSSSSVPHTELEKNLLQRAKSSLIRLGSLAKKTTNLFSALINNPINHPHFTLRLSTVKYLQMLAHDFVVCKKDKVQQGSCGIVYRQICCNQAETEAVILAKKVAHCSSSTKNPLHREFTILTAIPPHPNVVEAPYYANEGLEVLVMEYINQDLNTWLEQEHSMQDYLFVFRQILKGLKHTHDSDIMHGDIKPDNILVDSRSNIAKIADFGNATFTKKEGAHFGGTIAYIAPEFLEEGMKNVSTPSDVWSFGAVLLAVFTGKFLNYELIGIHEDHKIQEIFRALKEFNDQAAIFKLINQIGTEKIPAFCRVKGDVPKEALPLFKDLLKKLLLLKPQDRISAEEALNHPFFKLALGS